MHRGRRTWDESLTFPIIKPHQLPLQTRGWRLSVTAQDSSKLDWKLSFLTARAKSSTNQSLIKTLPTHEFNIGIG